MTSPYAPEIVPSDLNDPLKLQAFLDREFKNISKAMDAAQTVTLDPQFVAPAKSEEGVVYYADGTSWNPGMGEGYYGYINGAYVKLSLRSTDSPTFDILTVNTLFVKGTSDATPVGEGGTVVDSVIGTYSTNASITGAGSIIPVDDTIPLVTEGAQIISVSLTPKTTTNKLRVWFLGQATAATVANIMTALFVGSTCIDAQYIQPAAADAALDIGMVAEFSPASVAAQTIQVRIGIQIAATVVRLNGTSAARLFGGASNATLIVEEIKG